MITPHGARSSAAAAAAAASSSSSSLLVGGEVKRRSTTAVNALARSHVTRPRHRHIYSSSFSFRSPVRRPLARQSCRQATVAEFRVGHSVPTYPVAVSHRPFSLIRNGFSHVELSLNSMAPTPTPTRTLGMRLSCNFVNVYTIVYHA